MFDIDSYFSNYHEKESIFKDHDVLRSDFIPSNLPHRDTQMRKIAEIVACVLKESTPSNIFIFGKTGTGKTAVVKHVNKKLNQSCVNSNISAPKWIYLNCKEVSTSYRILAKICNDLNPIKKVPISGWPLDVIFDEMITRLENHAKGHCFLILDEIDILAKKTKVSHDILYNLTRINTNPKLTSTKVNLIGISNVLDFKRHLDPRVISSLGEEEIIFPSYNAMELNDILQQRANTAFNENILQPDVIPLCSALAAKEHGDARKALGLLRMAAELAERHNDPHIESMHVYMAQDEIEKDQTCAYYNQLPLQQKTIFLSIFQLQKYRPQSFITGDVYNCYREIQKMVPGLQELTQRRVSQIVKELDLSGLINAQTVSKGRHGRSKMIKLNMGMDDAYKYISDEKMFRDIVDYKPNYLNQREITGFFR